MDSYEKFLCTKDFIETLNKIFPDFRKISVKSHKKLDFGLTNVIFKVILKATSKGIDIEEKIISKFYLGEGSETRMNKEFISLEYLKEKGFSVPKPYTKMKHENISLLIMEFIEGTALDVELTSKHFEKSAPLVINLLNQLIDLHSFSISELEGKYSKNGLIIENHSISTYLNNLLILIEKSGLKEFKLLYDWLKENQPNNINSGRVYLHNDFHPFNSIMNEDQIIYIIDWEGTSFGDSFIDVSWFIFVTAGIFGKESEKFLLNQYNTISDYNLTSNNLEYYMILTSSFRLVIFSIILNDIENVREKDSMYKERILINYKKVIEYLLIRVKEVTKLHFKSFESFFEHY